MLRATTPGSGRAFFAAPDLLQRFGELVRLVDERQPDRRAVVAHRINLQCTGELLEHHPSARLTDQAQHIAQLSAQTLFDPRHPRLRSLLS
jgi:hypothetical protein